MLMKKMRIVLLITEMLLLMKGKMAWRTLRPTTLILMKKVMTGRVVHQLSTSVTIGNAWEPSETTDSVLI